VVGEEVGSVARARLTHDNINKIINKYIIHFYKNKIDL
jgi:hypothetical protein